MRLFFRLLNWLHIAINVAEVRTAAEKTFAFVIYDNWTGVRVLVHVQVLDPPISPFEDVGDAKM